MHIDSEGKFVRTDIWREGKWLDLWSVVHFLSGVTMGLFPKHLRLEAVSAYVITFLLLVLYEMFETLVKIKETRTNRFMDVVVGIASFALAHSFHPFITEPAGYFLLGTFFVSASVLSAVGWHMSQKAAVFEARLRAEIVFQKEKLHQKRLEFKERMQDRRIRRRLKKIEKQSQQ